MSRNKLKAALAILAATSSMQALAQSTNLPIPKPRSTTDQFGVNMATGRVELSDYRLTIGSGDTSLSDARHFVESAWRDEYNGTMITDGQITSVTIGGFTRTFNFQNGSYISREKDGYTLSNAVGTIFTLTGPSGIKYKFDISHQKQNANYYGRVNALLSQIIRPDGYTVDLYYSESSITSLYDPGTGFPPVEVQIYTVLLNTVKNNAGFQLKYDYAGNTVNYIQNDPDTWNRIAKVTAFNNTIDYCDPSATTCTFSQSWPSVTYTKTASGIDVLEGVVDPLGHTTTYTLRYGQQLRSIKPPRANAITYNYPSDSNMTVTSVSNSIGTWTYSWSGNNLTITDPLSKTNVITTDPTLSLVTSRRDAALRLEQFNYDPNGRLSSVTSGSGVQTIYTYDDRGNVTQTRTIPVVKSGQTTPADIYTYASYPSGCPNVVTCNKPVTTTDAMGNVTNYSYDPVHGGVTAVTQAAPNSAAARPETRYSYQALRPYYKVSGNAVVAGPSDIYRLSGSSTCAAGSGCQNTATETKTSIGYGTVVTANNLFVTSITKSAGDNSLIATSTFGYDAVGNQITDDGPIAGTDDTTRTLYDAARQMTEMVGPDPDGAGALRGRAVRVGRNDDGQVETSDIGTANPDGQSFTTIQTALTGYDALGRKTSGRLRMGTTTYATTQLAYDAANHVICSAQRMNKAGLDTLTNDPCVVSGDSGDGPDRITQYEYTAADEVSKIKSAQGTPATQVTRSLSYGLNGAVEWIKDAKSNQTSYVYDGFERPWRTVYADSSYEEATYGLSSSNRLYLTNARMRDGQILGYIYDNLGRITLKDRPGSESDTSYGYDNFGRPVTITNGATTLTARWDALDREVGEDSSYGSINYQYDLAGRRTVIQWGGAGSLYALYRYRANGDLWQIGENGATSGLGLLATYAYDDLGRRTRLDRGNGTATTWNYGATPWLTTLTHDLAGTTSDVTRSFLRSAAGEIVSATSNNDGFAFSGYLSITRGYTPDIMNKYAAVTGATLGYDGRGNLTSSTTSLGSTTYSYTVDNMLTSSSGGTFSYDGLDRLFKLGQSDTVLRYAGDQLISEQAATGGAVLRRYVPGAGPDEPLVWYEGSSTSDRRWFYPDERGSVIAIAGQDGALSTEMGYDEYGIPDHAGGAVRFGYTGQMWLNEIGAYHYKARIYSPSLGRFLQADPIGYAAGMNLYAYAGNNPVNYIDPSGNEGQDIIVNSTPLGAVGATSTGATGAFGGTPQPPSAEDIIVTAKHWPKRPDATFGLTGVTLWDTQKKGCSPGGASMRARADALASHAGPVTFDSKSEVDLLAQYFRGDTTPYTLNDAEMAQARSYVETYGDNVLGSSIKKRGDGLTERPVFFGRFPTDAPLLDGLLGTATGIFSGNNLVGLRDTFNFDFKDRGGYPYGTTANLGVAMIRADAASCAGDVSIPVSGGTR